MNGRWRCVRKAEKESDPIYNPADNRGAGSWVGNKLDKYPDGTRVKFEVK